jgi:type II secretion system (T2SS) protein E
VSGTPFNALEPVVPPKGLVPPSTPGGRPGFLSDVIVELGFAAREAVEQAVRAARSPGTTVERVLVESGALTEEQLARAMAERYGIDYIELGSFAVDPGAADLIEPAAAKRYQAVPVGIVDGVLVLAMADPTAALGLNDIADTTGMDVKPAVASRPALDALLGALPLGEAGEPVFLEEPAQPEPPADPVQEELVAVKAELARARAGAEEAAELRGRLERLEERLAAVERSAFAAERVFEGLRLALRVPGSVEQD